MSQFWEKYSDKIHPEPNSGCWFWMGTVAPTGYGFVRFDGITIPVHRVSYQIDRGAIPAKFQIDHACRIRCCCNPDHLEAVTAAENVRRAYAAKQTRVHANR